MELDPRSHLPAQDDGKVRPPSQPTTNVAVRGSGRIRRRGGFSLIELMVATAVGLFVVAATFVFIVHQNRLLEFTKRDIDRDRSGRVALDLLAQDVRHAGVGVGYQPDGTFNGLLLGTFTVPGGASFSAVDHPVALVTSQRGVESAYQSVTDDIGIRLANGSYRSIAQHGPGFGQVCAGGEYEAGDIVIFQTEDGIDAMTAKILSIGPSPSCDGGICASGCDLFTWAPDNSFSAGPNPATAEYVGGEMAGGFREIVWFVTDGGELRRAEVTAETPCTARDETCGGTAALDVETLQMRVWQWDQEIGTWEDRTASQTLTDDRRIRVDIEVVIRTRGSKDATQPPINLQLAPGRCLPECGQRDTVSRRALRTSVEVRNSGRLRLM